MTLDEGIKYAEKIAETNEWFDKNCLENIQSRECAEEHRQLAEWLKELKAYKYNETNGGLVEALMRSEAENERLHDELKAYKESCEDAISRQAVFDIDFKRIVLTTAKPAEMIEQKVKALPPVTPQPKMGGGRKQQTDTATGTDVPAVGRKYPKMNGEVIISVHIVQSVE